MKSEWKVQFQYCGDEEIYQVYRIRDIHKTDHSGNREYSGGIFYSKDKAQKYADELNSREFSLAK